MEVPLDICYELIQYLDFITVYRLRAISRAFKAAVEGLPWWRKIWRARVFSKRSPALRCAFANRFIALKYVAHIVATRDDMDPDHTLNKRLYKAKNMGSHNPTRQEAHFGQEKPQGPKIGPSTATRDFIERVLDELTGKIYAKPCIWGPYKGNIRGIRQGSQWPICNCIASVFLPTLSHLASVLLGTSRRGLIVKIINIEEDLHLDFNYLISSKLIQHEKIGNINLICFHALKNRYSMVIRASNVSIKQVSLEALELLIKVINNVPDIHAEYAYDTAVKIINKYSIDYMLKHVNCTIRYYCNNVGLIFNAVAYTQDLEALTKIIVSSELERYRYYYSLPNRTFLAPSKRGLSSTLGPQCEFTEAFIGHFGADFNDIIRAILRGAPVPIIKCMFMALLEIDKSTEMSLFRHLINYGMREVLTWARKNMHLAIESIKGPANLANTIHEINSQVKNNITWHIIGRNKYRAEHITLYFSALLIVLMEEGVGVYRLHNEYYIHVEQIIKAGIYEKYAPGLPRSYHLFHVSMLLSAISLANNIN